MSRNMTKFHLLNILSSIRTCNTWRDGLTPFSSLSGCCLLHEEIRSNTMLIYKVTTTIGGVSRSPLVWIVRPRPELIYATLRFYLYRPMHPQ